MIILSWWALIVMGHAINAKDLQIVGERKLHNLLQNEMFELSSIILENTGEKYNIYVLPTGF